MGDGGSGKLRVLQHAGEPASDARQQCIDEGRTREDGVLLRSQLNLQEDKRGQQVPHVGCLALALQYVEGFRERLHDVAVLCEEVELRGLQPVTYSQRQYPPIQAGKHC